MANVPSTSPAKERIVCLDECHCEIPAFDIQHAYTGYNNTSPELVAERIKMRPSLSQHEYLYRQRCLSNVPQNFN
jgi:hypothetical protein